MNWEQIAGYAMGGAVLLAMVGCSWLGYQEQKRKWHRVSKRRVPLCVVPAPEPVRLEVLRGRERDAALLAAGVDGPGEAALSIETGTVLAMLAGFLVGLFVGGITVHAYMDPQWWEGNEP